VPHLTPLIGTMVAGLVIAFLFGMAAHRLKLPPIVGYLLAGVVVGPFTPGYVADQDIATELAELGVILLMFGVGLHFSLRDLLSVRSIAVPGAVVQIGAGIVLGWLLGMALGWSHGAGLTFGLALSVASTVVLLRAMQERRLLETDRGKIAVGWLIVEDVAMVLALVLLPVIAASATPAEMASEIGITLFKVAAFVAAMLVIGRRAIPWLLHVVAHSGSRELFRLAVLAIALGVALGAALLFGVSFALGAFFAGMILAESPFSQRAGEETLPLRDAFAVLFFVSVGMLFNPAVLLDAPLALAATVAIIVVGKSLAAYFIVRAFGRDHRVALTIAASLAQIGEFSFILATLGSELELIPTMARDMILAGSVISILLNPLIFTLSGRSAEVTSKSSAAKESREAAVVLIGHGRVGSRIAADLLAAGQRVTLVESSSDIALPGRSDRLDLIIGNAASPQILDEAQVANARMLMVAIPETFEAGQIIEQARRLNPGIQIIARAHSVAEVEYLTRRGANRTIMGEEEIARRMSNLALAVR
jgi:CPA2 family monovalent cation:H+ antiporter-2